MKSGADKAPHQIVRHQCICKAVILYILPINTCQRLTKQFTLRDFKAEEVFIQQHVENNFLENYLVPEPSLSLYPEVCFEEKQFPINSSHTRLPYSQDLVPIRLITSVSDNNVAQ